MKTIDNKTVVLGPVRLSYLSVFKPRINNQKTPPVEEYSVTMLIPKANTEQLPDATGEHAAFKALIKAVAEEKFGAKMPPGFKNPIKDGDKIEEGQEAPRMPGYWVIRATAQKDYPPQLVDGNKNKITGGWNSGDHGRVVVRVFPFDKGGGKGVGVGLNAIQFTHKDESLGGASVGAEAFDIDPNAHTGGTHTVSAPDEYDPFADE